MVTTLGATFSTTGAKVVSVPATCGERFGIDFDRGHILGEGEGRDGRAQKERGDGGKEGFGGFHVCN